jgi:general secretion pathway protein K
MTPAPASNSRRFPRRRTAGSVILLVLVTILLASFLLTKFVARAGTELLADARAGDRAELRREAYSALETTLAVLADVRAIDQGLHSPVQGWDRPLDHAGYTPENGLTVTVGVEDESGKLSLPQADPATLETLFVSLGLGLTDAERVTDALLVWTRQEYAPASLDLDGSHYARAAFPHQPAGRPLRTFGELAVIEVVRDFFFDEAGRPTRLARDFQASVSLYSFERVNLNAAPPAVLAAAGLGLGPIDALTDPARRQQAGNGAGYYRAASEAAAVLGSDAALDKFGAEVRALRITVTVLGGATTYRLSAVVAPPGGATLAAGPPAKIPAPGGATPETATPDIKKLDYPFKVLEIREDVESPAEPTQHD